MKKNLVTNYILIWIFFQILWPALISQIHIGESGGHWIALDSGYFQFSENTSISICFKFYE